MDDVVVGIDIGTSKVCAVIGQVDKLGRLEILGAESELCSGVKKGIIVDIDTTAESIKAVANRIETASNIKIGSAYVNIMGTHVSIINSRFGIEISTDSREIKLKDVEKLLYMARSLSVPEGSQIIDIIPKQYIVDGYDEILDPVGMVGARLEVDVDVIAGKITSVQNIVKSMERAGISVDGLVVEALATGEMVLANEEKDMSVLLIDIGAGITDISFYKNRQIAFYSSIAVGGDHITNDISIGLKVSYNDAEKIKREYGLALVSLIKNDQEFSVNDLNDNKKKQIKVSEVVEIVEARVYEIFSLVRELLEKNNIKVENISEVVLAGGGIIYAGGSNELASEVLQSKVRIVSNKAVGLTRNEYITAAGIVKYILQNRKNSSVKGSSLSSDVKVLKPKSSEKRFSFLEKLSKIFNELF